MEIDLNRKILQEIGLDINDQQHVVDQDTFNLIQFNGKNIKYSINNPTVLIGKDDIKFDPINNVKLMSHLFTYHIDKIHEIDGIYYPVFYPIEGENGKGAIEAKSDNGTVVRSNFYNNDSLKYADLIMRINGEKDIDLSELDHESKSKKKRR
jgi:hypothetical protein